MPSLFPVFCFRYSQDLSEREENMKKYIPALGNQEEFERKKLLLESLDRTISKIDAILTSMEILNGKVIISDGETADDSSQVRA